MDVGSCWHGSLTRRVGESGRPEPADGEHPDRHTGYSGEVENRTGPYHIGQRHAT